MELTPLRYVLAIADARHMTRAAQLLGVTQPTLSAMLKKLETEVGTELFHRTSRGVELTDAGREFVKHAESAVRSADLAAKSVRQLIGLEQGSIRVGGGATAMGEVLPAVIGRVRREHPGLHFSVREAGSAAVAAAVLSGELDLGIVTTPINVPGKEDLFAVAEVDDELRLVVPRDHRLAASTAFRWADLANEPVVAFEAGSAVRAVIDAAAQAAGVHLDVVVELRSIQSILRMVEAGVGVGFVSRFALRGSEGLRCGDGRLSRALAVVRRRDRVPNHAAAAFERALLEALRLSRDPEPAPLIDAPRRARPLADTKPLDSKPLEARPLDAKPLDPKLDGKARRWELGAAV